MARRSPQEKKALSYAKDRRNDYHEHYKSSRKNIRRNKRMRNRVDRHRERQVMASVTGPVELEATEDAEGRLHAKKSMRMRMRWRKWRDAPLGDVVIDKLRHRAERGMVSSADSEERIERVRRHIGSGKWLA